MQQSYGYSNLDLKRGKGSLFTVMLNENGRYKLTDYVLEHADECSFIFKRKYSTSDKHSDSYYRRCFLCREINAKEFVPVEYDSEHKINQSKVEM